MRLRRHRSALGALAVLIVGVLAGAPVAAAPVTEVDRGRRWSHDGLPVVVLRGGPYELGYQHGALLKDDVRASINDTLVFAHRLIRVPLLGPWLTDRVLDVVFAMERPFIPDAYLTEMRGLADGSGVPLALVQRMHAVPEVTSGGCSSFVARGAATVGGRLLHSRNLDWNIEAGIQRHAVLFVVHPDGAEQRSFVSAGYAGFIGVLTGINSRGISVAQIGAETADRTYRGLPMPFLLRRIVEHAETLEEAVAIVQAAHRTVGYNYVLADGKRGDAVALETTRRHVAVFAIDDPREDAVSYAVRVPDVVCRADTALDPTVRERQRASKGQPRRPGIESPGGSAYATRYKAQSEQLQAALGTLTPEAALAIMRAAAPPSNVQSVLFAYPDLWVANARDLEPAATQPYHHFNVEELLGLRLPR